MESGQGDPIRESPCFPLSAASNPEVVQPFAEPSQFRIAQACSVVDLTRREFVPQPHEVMSGVCEPHHDQPAQELDVDTSHF